MPHTAYRMLPLSHSEISLLIAMDQYSIATTKELEQRLDFKPASAAKYMKSMLDGGLVIREKDDVAGKVGRKAWCYYLTERGSKLASHLAAARRAWLAIDDDRSGSTSWKMQ